MNKCSKCGQEGLAMYYFNKVFFCFTCFRDFHECVANYRYYL